MNTFIISQIFATGSLIVTILSFWAKKKTHIFSFLVLDCVFLILSYMMLHEFSGAFTNSICLFRNLFTIFANSNSKYHKAIYYVLFAIVHSIICVVTFKSPVDLLPLVAALISCIYSYIKDEKYIRIFMATMVFVWLVYDICIGSYVSILTESISFTSALIAITKYNIVPVITKKKLLTKQNDKYIVSINKDTSQRNKAA